MTLTVWEDVLYVQSPNCNDRPQGMSIDTIIVHGISLPPHEFGGDFVRALFTNTLDYSLHPYFETLRHLKVSAHLFINRAGVMMQFVPFDKRAWHAGESSFKGRGVCNDFSIGIELEGADDVPYTQAQYHSLVHAVQRLMQAYPAITIDRIVGHSDVAPVRKTDPGPAFDWTLFREMLQSRHSM